MMEPEMDKTQALQKLLNGTASEDEINLLGGGLVTGEISIGGNVNHSVIIVRVRPTGL
jgi:hypothetical protein